MSCKLRHFPSHINFKKKKIEFSLVSRSLAGLIFCLPPSTRDQNDEQENEKQKINHVDFAMF